MLVMTSTSPNLPSAGSKQISLWVSNVNNSEVMYVVPEGKVFTGSILGIAIINGAYYRSVNSSTNVTLVGGTVVRCGTGSNTECSILGVEQ